MTLENIFKAMLITMEHTLRVSGNNIHHGQNCIASGINQNVVAVYQYRSLGTPLNIKERSLASYTMTKMLTLLWFAVNQLIAG